MCSDNLKILYALCVSSILKTIQLRSSLINCYFCPLFPWAYHLMCASLQVLGIYERLYILFLFSWLLACLMRYQAVS